jgi:hypothetical protein
MTRDPVKLMLANARRKAKLNQKTLQNWAYIIHDFAWFHDVRLGNREDDLLFMLQVENGRIFDLDSYFPGLEHEDIQARLARIDAEVSASAGENVRPLYDRDWNRFFRQMDRRAR